jgi:MFS family permease
VQQGSKIFYGWWIALAAALGVACNFSLLVNATTGIFQGPLTAEFGWTRDAVMAATWYASVPAILSASLTGALVDRYGARRILFWSYVIQIVVLLSFRFIGQSIYGFYWRYLVLACLCMGTTNVCYVRLVGLWFLKRRGLALGIVLGGVGGGGALWSLLTKALIDHYGWRGTYTAMALIIAFIVLPLLMLVVRDSPAAKGLTVDGLPAPAGAAAPKVLTGYTLPEVVRLPHFWMLAFSLLLIGTAIQAVQINTVPLLKERGLTVDAAVRIQASLWIAIVFGRLSTGYLMDRFFAPRVAICYMLAPLVGLTLLALYSSAPISTFAAICVGLAAGCEIDVVAYLVSRYFGLKQYSRVYGIFYGIYGLAAAIGPWSAARISVSSVSGYTPALWVCVVLLVLGTALMAVLPRFPEKLPGAAASA